ncbi:MAG TPA: protein kinase [Pyrinomonadaceae bacterium]|nr:protein kinase [Pyrinomonadaceae bacterium]
MIGKTISHYKILGHVGEGGMGVVYVAEDTVLGRRVAIKIPHAGREENHYRARFLREARAVSKLRHPNIAAVYDYGETPDGQPYIVMELVSGQTLGDLLAGPGISLARAVEVTEQVAAALSEAHRRGVVHRDIKPSNVIVDETGEVKVLDFGLAKQLHEDYGTGADSEAQTLLSARTRSDVVIGTPLYLSPEQARGAKVDGRSDLFALGALLYECVAGRSAFSGSNVIEIGAQVLHYDPPPPSRFNPRIPSELDRLTLKALAKKPEERFQTADEFADDLERVRARLPHSDTTRTRRIVVAGANGSRSTALMTMAEGLRRPKFSPLTLLVALAALGLLIWGVAYARRPRVPVPPPDVARLYEQGEAAMREGAYNKASELLGQAVTKAPDFALARARLAEAMMEMDFLDRAKSEMLEVVKLTPDFQIYPSADALYLDAVNASVRQDNGAAIKDYQQIVNLNPNLPQSHLDLGRAYERDNQTDKAIRSYTDATERDPAFAPAYLRLGALHARVKNPPAAFAAFDSAQKLYEAAGDKEGQAAVHYQRGRFLVTLDKSSDARPELQRALDLAGETNNLYQQVQVLQQLAHALVKDDGDGARRLAQQAADLAPSSGMNDQVANSNVTLGIILLRLGDLDGADRAFIQALRFAQSYNLKRYEALASVNLASLRDKQDRPAEAEKYATVAREFYLHGNYRREVDQCSLLIARSRRKQGDTAGARKLLEENLRSAEQSVDMGLACNVHHEYGMVLITQDDYAHALEHFRESANMARALRNTTVLTYSQLNEAGALWRLGHYDEAEKNFAELNGAAPQSLGIGKNAVAIISLNEANMELSRRRFPKAAAEAKRALALLKETDSPPNDLLAWAYRDLGQVESATGSRERGRELCVEADRLASLGGDLPAIALTKFVLARALLAAGDAEGARAAALEAQERFTRFGGADVGWQALAVAGLASRLAGDENAAREYFDRAATSLAQFEESLGADAKSYGSRPDVQWLRSEFVGSAPH